MEAEQKTKKRRNRKPLFTPLEKKIKKQIYDKMRRRSHLNIGGEIERWERLKDDFLLASHEEVARLLLDKFEESNHCSQCQARRLHQEEVHSREPAVNCVSSKSTDDEESVSDGLDLELSVETPADDSIPPSCSREADTPNHMYIDEEYAKVEDQHNSHPVSHYSIPGLGTIAKGMTYTDTIHNKPKNTTEASNTDSAFQTRYNLHRDHPYCPKQPSIPLQTLHFTRLLGVMPVKHSLPSQESLSSKTEEKVTSRERIFKARNGLMGALQKISKRNSIKEKTETSAAKNVEDGEFQPKSRFQLNQETSAPMNVKDGDFQPDSRFQINKETGTVTKVEDGEFQADSNFQIKKETSPAMNVEDGEFQPESRFQINKETSAVTNVEDGEFQTDSNFQIKTEPLDDGEIYHNVSDSMCEMTS